MTQRSNGRRAALRTASEEDLFARLPDPPARDELARRHLPLARHLARRFAGRGEAVEDLYQVACLAMIKALDRFDPQRGVKFSTYAGATIVGEIKRHFRDRAWTINVPRGLQENALRVSRARAELAQELGRSPTPADIARRTGLTEDQVLEAAFTADAYGPLSLEATSVHADGEGRSLLQKLGFEDTALDLVERWSEVEEAIMGLPERERTILRLRFHDDLTQREIGRRLGISQMHVSRLLARTLEEIRLQAHPDGLPTTSG